MRISDWSAGVCSSDLVAPPRPVLVVHPAAAADAAPLAFSVEVRAREESPLSFRVGGNLVRRFVDVGDVVHRGALLAADRKSVVSGKSVSVRVDIEGRRILTTKNRGLH